MISRDSIRSLQGPKARERCRHWADVCTKNGGLEITVSTEKGGSDAQRHGLNVFMYVCVSLYIYIYISVYSIHLYICIVYHRYPTLQSWKVFFFKSKSWNRFGDHNFTRADLLSTEPCLEGKQKNLWKFPTQRTTAWNFPRCAPPESSLWCWEEQWIEM